MPIDTDQFKGWNLLGFNLRILYVTIQKEIGHNVQKHKNVCSVITLELHQVWSSFLV